MGRRLFWAQIAGLMRAYGNALINAIAFVYYRGHPAAHPIVSLQVMSPATLPLPVLASIRIDPMTTAILAIVINAGAYIAEIGGGGRCCLSPRA